MEDEICHSWSSCGPLGCLSSEQHLKQFLRKRVAKDSEEHVKLKKMQSKFSKTNSTRLTLFFFIRGLFLNLRVYLSLLSPRRTSGTPPQGRLFLYKLEYCLQPLVGPLHKEFLNTYMKFIPDCIGF